MSPVVDRSQRPNGNHTITWSGASTSPNGDAPSYPTSTVSFTSGVSTTTLTATLFAAGSNSLTASASSPSLTGTTTISVSAASATRLAWTHISSTSGTAIPSPCLFTCSYSSFGNSKSFTANVGVTDNFGNTVNNLGSGHSVSVAFASGNNGTITGGSLTISSTGAADSTTQFTYTSKSSGNYTDGVAAATSAGTSYTNAIATFIR